MGNIYIVYYIRLYLKIRRDKSLMVLYLSIPRCKIIRQSNHMISVVRATHIRLSTEEWIDSIIVYSMPGDYMGV